MPHLLPFTKIVFLRKALVPERILLWSALTPSVTSIWKSILWSVSSFSSSQLLQSFTFPCINWKTKIRQRWKTKAT
jgi:hypothetical protein